MFFLFFTVNTFSQAPVVQEILNNVDQDSLIYFIRELSGNVPTNINGTSQTILSRNKYQPGNLLAETYIKQKLESYGLTTTIQSFSGTGKNVYAVQPGNEFPNQKYIICAHFDDMPSGSIAPGADDNASGTAAVIEAARIFSQYSFPYTIIYALWDEEEQGLIGSDYYAAQAYAAGDSILGVINLDMISYESNGDGVMNLHSRPTAGNSDEIRDMAIECNSVYGINLDIVVISPGETYSDHASFWSRNYGAILLIEDDFDFHPYYHTINDLIQYCNQDYLYKMAKLGYATLASLALDLNLNIIHTPIASISESVPITTSATIATELEIGTGNLGPRLYYRTKLDGGSFGPFISVEGIPVESGDYYFTIPAVQLGSVVQYYLAAQDANSMIVKTLPRGGSGFNPPGNIPPPSFFQFYIASQIVAFYDEANTINGWISSGGWNITTAKYVSPPTSFTDSPGGNYLNNTTAILKLNSLINLDDALGAALEFDTQWAIETDWDYGQVQISTNNGSTWISLEGLYTNQGTNTQPNEPLYDGTQLTWVHENIDISGFMGQSISLRFLFVSDYAVTADGWYVDNIKITQYESQLTFQLSVFMSNGWNMVSVPGINPNGQGINNWWPGLIGAVYEFIPGSGYSVVLTTSPGDGYWMKQAGDNIYNTGDEWPAEGIQFVQHDPISAEAGWNLFGGYENTFDAAALTTTPPGQIVYPIYQFASTTGYQSAAQIIPGYGYWVKVSSACQINIPNGLMGDQDIAEYFKNEWGKIIFTDAAGSSSTLYSVKGNVDLNRYELPPLPPSGIFDVRYGSGRVAEDLNAAVQTIELRGMTYPVKVRVENTDIRMQDETGKYINTNLKSGEELTLSNPNIDKLMVSGSIVPDQYILVQNYPNPFNPSTTIEFSLPENVKDVKLSIYNILGEKVAELVNGSMQTGKYKYEWNAKDFASGIYMYELRTENFVSTKKMILVK